MSDDNADFIHEGGETWKETGQNAPGEGSHIMAILDQDHPGASDPAYRKRREYIAGLASKFRADPDNIPLLEYTPEEHAVWKEVSEILSELQPQIACSGFLVAKKFLDMPKDHIPQMRGLSNQISKFHGMRLGPIEGLVDSRSFLSQLGDKRMLCTQYIRHPSRPTFTPEPDAIHEFLGHVPMFADKELVEFGRLIGLAAKGATDEQITQLERLYWFTIEYGLVDENGTPKSFGAGLLSDIENIRNAHKTDADIRPFDLEEVINTDYNYSFVQTKYFVVPSLGHLRRETEKLIDRYAK